MRLYLIYGQKNREEVEMKKFFLTAAMAVCLFTAEQAHGVCTGSIFDDVNEGAVGAAFCEFIERFSSLGITAGCSTAPPLYCPSDVVTRGQMAVFVTKTIEKLSAKTPQQIALLKWYEANQAATFAVGDGPRAVAFDGANIWVSNSLSNNVTKLRANDGDVLGTFPVGSNPVGLAFDGANIWVANDNSSVSKL